MPKFPSEATLRKMDKKLKRGVFTATLQPGASASEQFKFALCKEILCHMKDERLTQRELAHQLGVHESRVSEIIHYKVAKVSVDRLMQYLEMLRSSVRYKLVV
jgi:predicted XRE-type DNA-binding protein